MNLKPASLGSIYHGTLRTEYLLSAFIEELEWQVNRNGDWLSLPENFHLRKLFSDLIGEAQDCFADDGETIAEQNLETASELINEDFPRAFETFTPLFAYFGTHPGDGSDFGFWISDDIEELPTVKGSDEAKELGETCKSVNDHGNVTVYGGDGSILLEVV